MFRHEKQLQYNAKPDKPDALYAKYLQELLAGPVSETTAMMQYLMQGWSCRAQGKYRDMLLDIGTEEMAHVEMLATMIAQLLEGAPVSAQEDAAKNPALAAAMGGMNPQHLLIHGMGPAFADSTGYPFNGRYVTSTGNLLVDMRANLWAESRGRLQAVRLYEMTDDAGVRDMLSFLIARDTMHQNQFLAAIEEIESDGLEKTPVPHTFPRGSEKSEVAYQYWDLSEGGDAREGRWASGPAPDGEGTFQYLERPQPLGQEPELRPVDPRMHGTPANPPGLLKRLFGGGKGNAS